MRAVREHRRNLNLPCQVVGRSQPRWAIHVNSRHEHVRIEKMPWSEGQVYPRCRHNATSPFVSLRQVLVRLQVVSHTPMKEEEEEERVENDYDYVKGQKEHSGLSMAGRS